MATLKILAKPSDGLERYTLVVDGLLVSMRSDDKGAVSVLGSCGDGSRHKIAYTLVGSAGATLSASISCGDRVVCVLEDIKIFPIAEPYAAGAEDFSL